MITFQRRKSTQVNIHLTALIDMVFLLLIYFLLTSNFVSHEGIDIELPKVQSDFADTEDRVLVVVDEKGRFLMEEKALSDTDLGRYLTMKLQGEREPAVIINADRRVEYDRVVQAMDIAKQSGAVSLLLATEKESGRP